MFKLCEFVDGRLVETALEELLIIRRHDPARERTPPRSCVLENVSEHIYVDFSTLQSEWCLQGMEAGVLRLYTARRARHSQVAVGSRSYATGQVFLPNTWKTVCRRTAQPHRRGTAACISHRYVALGISESRCTKYSPEYIGATEKRTWAGDLARRTRLWALPAIIRIRKARYMLSFAIYRSKRALILAMLEVVLFCLEPFARLAADPGEVEPLLPQHDTQGNMS